jgi:hypothetical protein
MVIPKRFNNLKYKKQKNIKNLKVRVCNPFSLQFPWQKRGNLYTKKKFSNMGKVLLE